MQKARVDETRTFFIPCLSWVAFNLKQIEGDPR